MKIRLEGTFCKAVVYDGWSEYQTQFTEDRESRAIPVSSESRIQWTLERGSRTGGLLSLLTDYTRVDVHIYVGGHGKYG